MAKITITNGNYSEEITEAKYEKLADHVKRKFKVTKKATKKEPIKEETIQ